MPMATRAESTALEGLPVTSPTMFSSENDHGSMNLASNTASVPSTTPSSVPAIQGMAECLTQRWTFRLSVALIPAAVELLGSSSELHDEVAGQVLRLGLAPFLPPKADQGSLIAARLAFFWDSMLWAAAQRR